MSSNNNESKVAMALIWIAMQAFPTNYVLGILGEVKT